MPGMYAMGDLEVAPTPTPGSFYRIHKGDNLLKVAERAFGSRKGRYGKAKWINNADANQDLVRKDAADNLFPQGKISFRPIYASDAVAASEGAAR